MSTNVAVSPSGATGCGGRLIAADGRILPLCSIELAADACAGLARVVLRQRFANPWPEPLVVSYSLPLPHDGAVSGFSFRLGERRVVGEIERREAARERFEQALLEGRSAALLDQERASLFTQQIGNVPPGEDIVAELIIDQPLAWLGEGAWEWRFPLAVAPRYLGETGRVADAGRVFQAIAEGGAAPRLAFEVQVRDELAAGGMPTSPSHPLLLSRGVAGWQARLGEQADEAHGTDRDVVVRWPAAGPHTGTALDLARSGTGSPLATTSYGLLAIVPPLPEHRPESVPRDLVLLMDTSGSMHGQPLAQAKAVAVRLVQSLAERDSLEVIAFGSSPQRWRREPVPGTGDFRADAVAWIGQLEAGGGTEMVTALLAALRPRRDGAQRQVVLVSDGLVGFESDAVAAVRAALAPRSRLHSVGVGTAVNRSLTAACARAGRGIEVLVGGEEELEQAVARLLARVDAPLVTELRLAGDALIDAVPGALPDLYAGAPARLALRLRPEGGTLRLHGRMQGQDYEAQVVVEPCAAGMGSPAVVALYGREAVEDLELDLAVGAERTVTDARIERLGLAHGIATRLTSWVAVSEERDADPHAPLRRVRQPQRLPQGLSAEMLGLDAPLGARVGRFAASVSMELRSSEAIECLDASYEPPAGAREAWSSVDFPSRPLGASRAPAPPRPHLEATLVRRDGRLLHFEIRVTPAPLDWRLPQRVELLWDDVPRVVELCADLSTAEGPVSAGASLRLAVRVAADAPHGTPAIILLHCALHGERRIRVVKWPS